MLVRGDHDLGQKQRSRPPAARQQFIALDDCIFVAITARWREQPLRGRQAAWFGNDVVIDFTIVSLELVQSLYCQRDIAPAKKGPMNRAVVPVARHIASSAEGWRYEADVVKLDISARGKLMNDASEIETQQVSAIAMAIARALLFVA